MQIRGIRNVKRVTIAIIATTLMFAPGAGFAASGEGPHAGTRKVRKLVEAPLRLLFKQFEAKSLVGNGAGQSATASAQIFLPPSYYTHPKRRFPVIYFLHGYGDRASLSQNPEEIDDVMTAKGMQEFIIVEPHCANAFYVNSPATANWEDFVTKDLVEWVDSQFRTVAHPSARGVGGFSMGGFGAINLGLRHPDVFQAVFAVAPGLVDNSALKSMKGSWNTSIANDYAAAFSPDVGAPGGGMIPVFDGSASDDAIVRKWEDGFGNLDKKVATYKALSKRLAGLAIQVGNADYAWLVQGSLLFDQILNREGLPHRFELTEDYHSLSEEFATTRIIPFFSYYLKNKP